MKFRRRNTTTNATINHANANAEGTAQQDPNSQADKNLLDNASTPSTTTPTTSRINTSSSTNTPMSAAKKVKEDEFSARRSARIVSDIHSDNDVWCEYLAVVEMLIPGGATRNGEETYELQIRSFFESTLSGTRAWDEPPSGAHTIQYASMDAKQMAQTQMDDLQAATTLDIPSPPPTTAKTTTPGGSGSSSKGRRKGKGSIRNLFQKRGDKSQRTMEPPKGLTYKSGSATRELLEGTTTTTGAIYNQNTLLEGSGGGTGSDEGNDDLEKTIIASLEQTSLNEESCRLARLRLEEQEAVDMAKAFSLSEECYNLSYGNVYQGFEYGEHCMGGGDEDAKLEAQPNIDRGVVINQDDHSRSNFSDRQMI